MKITTRLAANQIKKNRKRTLGTIAAIALSTALLAAVFSFAASTADMLAGALGDSFGEYGAAYRMMIVIPAIILSFLIAFMSAAVISNIFQASADGRIRELGVLKCVGGTKKQIRETVISEGLLLSIIGIPAGLILGALLGFLSVKIAGLYIDRIVEITKSIIMRRFDLKLGFSAKPGIFIAAALFSLCTVLISALRPAKRMSRITALECVSFGNRNRQKAGKTGRITGSGIWKKLFGFEGELGARNINRNGKAFRPAVRALSTGICLLLVTASLALQLADIEKLMKSEHNRLLIDYTSLQDEGVNSLTGRRQDRILHPIDADTYNGINDRLNEFGDFEVWGIGSNRAAYFAKADETKLTADMKAAEGALNEYGDMDLDMVSLTEDLYRRICEAAGTEYGGNILINTYVYNNRGTRREIAPFTEDIREFTLITPAGETKKLPVDGILDRADLEEWLFDWPNRAAVMVIVPGAEARYFDWYCEPGDKEDAFISYARSVMDERFPVLTDDSYADQGYSVRISREDTLARALNVMLILGEVVLYGFVLLLTLMGFAGFISTVTAGIRARTGEFAVLKSVGMTGGALRKMLYSESLYCTVKAALRGVFFGVLIPWLISLSLRAAFPVRYHFPIAVTIASIGITFITVLIITRIEIRRMKGQSIIETIRMDSIR